MLTSADTRLQSRWSERGCSRMSSNEYSYFGDTTLVDLRAAEGEGRGHLNRRHGSVRREFGGRGWLGRSEIFQREKREVETIVDAELSIKAER
jgi:hypothetical protein